MMRMQSQEPLSARIFRMLPKIAWYAFLVYIALVIILNVAVAPFMDFSYRWSLTPLGILFLLIGVVLGVGCCLLAQHLPISPNKAALSASDHPSFFTRHRFGVLIVAGAIILCAIQAFLVQSAWFTSFDWDWALMTQFDNKALLANYYSRYPNNYFLGGLLAMLNDAGMALGMEEPYILLVAAGCACITASVVEAAFIGRALGGKRCGLCTFLLAFAFLGINPYLFIPYSDSYCILFTTTTLLIFACCKHPVKWPLMIFVSLLGYAIKPTALAVLGAAAFVSACLWARDRLTERTRQPQEGPGKAPKRPGHKAAMFAATVLGCGVAVLLSFGTVNLVRGQVGIQTDPELPAMNPQYFLMVGLNTQTDGMFSHEDRNFAFSFATEEEQDEATAAVWATRLHMLGPDGLLQLMIKKTLIIYDSGDALFPRRTNIAFEELNGSNPAVMAFYGIEYGERDLSMEPDAAPSPWSCIAQALWFMILAGIVLNLLRRSPSRTEEVIALSLLLLSGYLLISECSARYLFLYMPFYVILAVRGWQVCAHRIRAHRLRSATTSDAQPPIGA